MLERMDVVTLARNTEDQCRALLEIDSDIDVVLMVGVGAANAGELVVDGRASLSSASSILRALPIRKPMDSVSTLS